MSEWKGVWRCEKCGEEYRYGAENGSRCGASTVRADGKVIDCLGPLVPYERRKPSDAQKQREAFAEGVRWADEHPPDTTNNNNNAEVEAARRYKEAGEVKP